MTRGASIEMRLRNLSALNAGLLIIAGLLGALSLKVSDATVQDYVERLDPLTETNREVLQALTDAETGLRGFGLTGDGGFLTAAHASAAEFETTLARAHQLAGDDADLRALLDEQDRLGHEWLDAYAWPMVDLWSTDRAAALARIASGEGVQRFDAFRQANIRTQNALGDREREAADSVHNTRTAMAALGLIVTFTAAGVGFVLARRLARSVSRPLRSLGAALTRLTGGDLSTRVEVAGPPEVAAVAGALNDMAGEMERLTRLERQQAVQEQLIRATARGFLEHLDEDEVLRAAAEGVGRALAVDRTVVWAVHEGDADELRAAWVATGTDPDVHHHPPAELVAMVRAAIEDVGVARIDDVDGDPTLAPEARAHLQRLGVRSILLAPLLAFDEPVAVLGIECLTAARPWSTADVAIARGVARELAVALEHAQVFAQQQATVDELRRLDDAKAMFISSVSHDLRTPLTSIIGYTELLLDGDAGPLARQQRDMAGVIDRNARRLLTLIDDLLTLSRLDAGARGRSRALLDVAEVVDAAIAAVGPLLAGRDLVLRLDVARDLPPVWGDRDELERVVINLLSNAFKFTGDGGSVSVEASVPDGGDEVDIAVADTGPGIPEDEQQHVFSRFFRSSAATRDHTPGTGLGLAIVKGIVEDHGGQVTVRSVPGEGATFLVRLPTATPVTADRADAVIARSVPAAGGEY